MIRRGLRPLSLLFFASLGAVMHAACGSDGQGADCADGCAPEQICRDGHCVDGAGGGGGFDKNDGGGGSGPCAAEDQCGTACCTAGQFCALGVACAVDQGTCASNDDCGFDSYCEGGACIPYGLPGGPDRDPTCTRKVDIGAIEPDVQCAWTGPPATDAHPAHIHVMSTPVVVDFNFDDDPNTLAPSIVFTSFPTSGTYQGPGVLRVIHGKDCTQQFSFDDAADATMAPASVAVGDIDGDGRAEIVAAAHGGGLLAFKYDAATGNFRRLWRSGTCAGGLPPQTPDTTGGSNKWSGPSIHDLDGDGSPEIIYGATVYGANGCIKSNALGFPAYSSGYIPVIADIDEDGKMELIQGDAIHEWDAATNSWVPEPYFTATAANAKGQVAIADMGNYPLASFGGQDRPEIVVVSAGKARVQTLEGTIVFGPVDIPGGGTGGPPTIADFDGDGRPEFATAGGNQYVVFDLDCVAGGDPAKCGGQSKTDGVLWSQPSQDASSNVTGSSVFDFDADGKAEAVYADECFLRIYEGATGKVLYSAARSSGTTYENPVIVDVDGDYRTEIVSAVNSYANFGCPAADPLMASSAFSQSQGIVVLRDQEDRWAASRPVWNQHAYAVTNVGDRGEIPASGAVKKNWKDPTLNNFRQNVQGDLEALGMPDLTAGGEVGAVKCVGTKATIEARVCNRGTLPMVSGTEVSFMEGTEAGTVLCTAPIPKALHVAECMVVSCEAELGDKKIDVFVKVDPKGESAECWESNNTALYKGVACGHVPVVK